ncbi:MAG: fatty acid desaturase [Burkholderiales bacterium]|nr:fatty acid desaturase [Burkholderiales bacterium]
MSKIKQTVRARFPIPDRLSLVITLAQVAISLMLLWASSRLMAEAQWLGLAGCALIFSFVMQTGFSLLHEAEHRKLHSHRQVNDLLGFMCATMFPGSYQLMTVAHLNHHKVNRSDAELVDYIRPGESATTKWIQFYALITGLIWLSAPLVTFVVCLTPTGVLSKWFDKGEGSSVARYLAFIQRAGAHRVRAETALGLLLWVLTWRALGLQWQAVAICYAAFAFSWSSQQYIYHVRTPRHLIEGAYDLKLWRPMQWLYLNFNFHLSHHRLPNVPWLYMPQVASEVPTRGYLRTYLALWAPPQPVDQAWPVEHQIKGRLAPRPAADLQKEALAA